MSKMRDSRKMKVAEAIAAGMIPAPPQLREAMIWSQAQLAEARGKDLVRVRYQLKYKGEIDGPTLLVHDDCIFELVDVYHPATGSGRIAARRDETWFRLIGSSPTENDDLGFLTWCYHANTWQLTIFDQHLA